MNDMAKAGPVGPVLPLMVWGLWERHCKAAFARLKEKLASAEVSAHYDSSLPHKLDCNASGFGVLTVLPTNAQMDWRG